VSRYLILDLESYRIDNAADYLTEPVEAPSNYKDPAKIEAWIAEAKQAQLDKAALDIDLARIVCLGWLEHGPADDKDTHIFKDDIEERRIIGQFFDVFFQSRNTADWPILVTFNGLGFDLPLLLRRALYLGVRAPNIQIDRYKHPHVIDLMALLNLDGRLKSHSLRFYANRFGIPVDDESTGADIGALVEADNWQAVEAHCASDVAATYALAKRMGVLA
jgi:predicted PolB exonuclease-like 3'-5' exonuclease